MSLKRKMKKGFTLVELVVVIAVIAILSAVSVGAYFGITESANSSAAEQGGKQFHTALVTIANDPSYDDDETNKHINVKSDGTVEFNYTSAELEGIFETFSGLKYTFAAADSDPEEEGNQAPVDPANNTVWMVSGEDTLVYYTNGKAATVTIKTGSIDVA